MKKLVIDTCDECPHFDNSYYDWNRKCTKLDREIPFGEGDNTPIPNDCPLEDEEQNPS